MSKEEKFNINEIMKNISPYGQCEKLRSARPKDDVAGYVWRMIRFHAGIDYHQPFLCFFRLFDTLHARGMVKEKFLGIFNQNHKKILDDLDPIISKCAKRLGLSDIEATRRHKGLLF